VEASVPGTLIERVLKTAAQSPGTTAVAGAISEGVMELTKGVMKAMLLTKLKTITAPLLILAMTGIAGGFFFRQATGQQPSVAPEAAATKPRESEDRSRRVQSTPPARELSHDTDPQEGVSSSRLRQVKYAVVDLVIPIPGMNNRGIDGPFV